MSRIAVTGGGGFVEISMVERFLEEGGAELPSLDVHPRAALASVRVNCPPAVRSFDRKLPQLISASLRWFKG